MRVDLFLKTSGLVKRRITARELCENGRVLLNHQEVKPAKEVRQGDRVTLRYSSREIEIEIVQVDAPREKKIVPEDRYIVKSDTRTPKEQDAWSENR